MAVYQPLLIRVSPVAIEFRSTQIRVNLNNSLITKK